MCLLREGRNKREGDKEPGEGRERGGERDREKQTETESEQASV